jgi:threonine dehydrogenase-like Zn-dependent dehydrogenase
MTETFASRQFWIQAPGRGEILERDIPAFVEGSLRIRALYSGISRGTESLVFRGEVPSSQFEAMQAPFQEGSFPGPVKYGYASVGRVEAGPAGPLVPGGTPAHLPQALLGRTVFCLHPHQDVYWVPPEAVTPLPGGLPPGRAILAANMETAVNAVWDGGPAPGDRIVVVGGGVVGLLIAWLCGQFPGCEVTVEDVNPGRRPIVESLGLVFAREGEGTADLVFHASGNPDGLTRALELAGPEATVMEVSWYGTRSVPLPLGEAFHSRRLTLKSSQVGRIPPLRAPRWDTARRMRLALELLRADPLDALISGESGFHELPDVMARLSTGPGDPGDTLCHRIRYAATP